MAFSQLQCPKVNYKKLLWCPAYELLNMISHESIVVGFAKLYIPNYRSLKFIAIIVLLGINIQQKFYMGGLLKEGYKMVT
jgi:hypothetical protein